MGVHRRSGHAVPGKEVKRETSPRCRANSVLPDAWIASALRWLSTCRSDEIYSRRIFEGEQHSIISLDMQELELEWRR
jgi:hypothetical protein